MIPKSLHTVTALINLARHLAALHSVGGNAADCIDNAARILGYADAPDVHGLKAKARAVLSKVRA